MHRPDHDSAVAVRPATAAAGTPGWFQDGNPAEAIRGTLMQADFLNDLVANLLAVLAAGGVTPVKGDDNNLRDAINAMVAAGTVPVGSLVPFAASAAPAGWLKLNGVLLSRTTYADLFAFGSASGNYVSDAAWIAGRPGSFSDGDGSTTFRIPDFRGLFLRGFHDGSSAYESNTGVTLGQYRDSQNKAHTHDYTASNFSGSPSRQTASDSISHGTRQTGSEGGAESFPRHTSVLWCIKY